MDPLNPFAALDDAMAEACEEAFAIRARIEAYTSAGPYGDGRPDMDRGAVDVRGILSSTAATEGAGGKGTDRFGGPTRVAGQSIVFGLSPATVRCLPWEIQPDDRLVLPDVASPYPTRFKVSALRPTDMGDLELILTEANEG